MNTFKKLMFGLLLSGMAFTAACGDDGVKPGAACKKADECGELKCVIKNAGDKSGTCEKPCTTANVKKDCTDSKKATCGGAIAFGKKDTDPKVNVCMAGAAVKPGTAELGAPCDASGDADKTCKPNAELACYMGHCYATCTSAANEAAAPSCQGKMSGADKTVAAPDCKVDGDTKVCVAPIPTAGDATAEEGQPCKDPADASATAGEKCKVGLVCVKITAAPGEPQKCAIKCEHPDTKDAACTSSTLGNKCTSGATVEVPGGAPVSVCYGKMPGTLGDDCSATEPCDATHFCHTDDKCWVKCDAVGDNTKCSAARKGDDTDVDAPTCTASGSGFICSA